MFLHRALDLNTQVLGICMICPIPALKLTLLQLRCLLPPLRFLILHLHLHISNLRTSHSMTDCILSSPHNTDCTCTGDVRPSVVCLAQHVRGPQQGRHGHGGHVRGYTHQRAVGAHGRYHVWAEISAPAPTGSHIRTRVRESCVRAGRE